MARERKQSRRSRLLLLTAGSLVVAACGDSPVEPVDDVNPALAELADGLQQGSATFAGPGGLPMDATGVEFIQRMTRRDGTVLRTSGVQFFAVPGVGTADPPFDRMAVFAAMTGSLESVPPGTYPISELPDNLDYVTEIPANVAWIGWGDLRDGEQLWADSGTFTITSLSYFPDVFECDGPSHYIVELCQYQIGEVSGVVQFRVPLPGGSEVVQQETSFSVPIRRSTLFARQP
jgi:hypothetical protein